MSPTRLRCSPAAPRGIAGRFARREDGSALLTVILVTVVILTLGVLGARSAQVELRVARNDTLAKTALYAADAGVNHTYSAIIADGAQFNNYLGSGGTGGALSGVGSVVTLADGLSYRFRSFGGTGSSDGYYIRVVDNFDETAGANDPTTDVDSTVDIISRGRIGGAERVIRARVQGTPLFSYDMFGKISILLSGGSDTDSYDSRNGAYATGTATPNGNIRSNGSITLTGGSGNTVVSGNATAGTTISNGGTITGTQTPNASPISLPSVAACGPPYSANTGISGTGYSYSSATGALNVSGGSSFATLANGTYCFSTVKLQGGSTLNVNGPVVMYVTGTFGTSGGGYVNNSTAVPANFLLFSSYNDISDNHGVELSGSSASYMAVYAPDAQVTYSGSSDLFGAMVGGKLTYSGGSGMHYDKALGSLLSGSGLTGWREVRSD